MHRYTRLCLLGASRLSGARLSVEYERGSSWRSAYGTKRTNSIAAVMSANDPKRTYAIADRRFSPASGDLFLTGT